MTKQITLLQGELAPVVREATKLEIKNSDEMKVATELLSRINVIMDRVTEEKEKVTKPLLEALAAERARWKPMEQAYNEASGLLRQKMSTYQSSQIAKAKEEEDKIASRVGEGKGKLSVDTATKKIENIKKVDKAVSTETGTVKFREDKKLKITDISLIPREYLVVDEVSLLKALKAGKAVPGAKVEIVLTPINFR